jgi:uncharacterized protein (TIGR00251 family)
MPTKRAPVAISAGELALHEGEGWVELGVRVAPRAARAAIVGVHAGALKVSLTAPPVDGAANAALLALLAEALQLPRSALELTRGQRARNKTVRIHGFCAEALRRALAAG